jgi:hypothetical protein
MKTIQLNLYSFEELNETARQSALIVNRYININVDWRDYIYDDFVTICGCLGIAVDKTTLALRGLMSDGDGSGFNAEVSLSNLFKSIQTKGWRGYAPKLEFNFQMPDIDQRVLALIKYGKLRNAPQILKRRDSNLVVVDLGVFPVEGDGKSHDMIYGELDELEKWLDGIAQVLKLFLQKSLQNHYEYLISAEAISETIKGSDYLFTADGGKANRLATLSIL